MPTNININMKHNIQLRVGGRYLNRKGQEIEIVSYDAHVEWSFRDAHGDRYRPDGTFSYYRGEPMLLDLVEEIPTEDPRIPILEARVAELEARLAPARAPAPTTYRYFRSDLAEWRVAAGSEAAECRLIGKSEWGPAYTIPHELLAAKDRPHHPVRECDQDGRLLEAEPQPPTYRYFRSDRTEWRVADGGEEAECRRIGRADWGPAGSTIKDLLAARDGWRVDVRECDQDGRMLEAEPAPVAYRYFRSDLNEWRVAAGSEAAECRLIGERAWYPALTTLQDLLVGAVLPNPVRECDQDGRPLAAEPPNPGPGYRLVDRGELIETGDEWWEDGKWVETCFTTEQRVPKEIDTPLRRLSAPTYRLLRPGETIREGDEWLKHMSSKVGELDTWSPASSNIDNAYDPATHTPYRRQVAHYQDHP